MSLTRRRLLGAATGAAGGAATAGLVGTVAACEPERGAAPAPPLDPDRWDSVRAQFALNPDVAHLSMYVLAPHPASVRAAIGRHREGLDRDGAAYLHDNAQRLDAAIAEEAARYLRTRPEQLAFTDSTTMGLGLLYGGLRLGRGDEVLTTEHDFYATHEALRLRSERDGVTVRRVRLYADPSAASEDEIVAKLAGAVTARTRVIALTWVHSSTGVKLPIRAIVDAVRSRNPRALVCVDAVHGFGAEETAPDRLGCDFLVTGCHKWLLGPRGTGLVWGTYAAWSRATPTIPSFDGSRIGSWLGFDTPAPAPGSVNTPGGYHSFEHRWALADAFAFHTAVGPDRVAARTRELASALKDGLVGLTGVRLITPRAPEVSAGLVCCEVDGIRPDEAVSRLRAAGVVATSTPYRVSYLRFGPTVANSDRDLEAALRAVSALR
jgi:selenocysteine lyase/cysteine desulfurase